MKTVVAALLCALSTVAIAGPSLASGAGEKPAAAEGSQAEGQAMPEATGPVETDGQPPQDQAGSNEDVMKNVTRHRPGACPEGPPCQAEDEGED